MAKQLVSPVERHLEKLLLAIAVLALLASVARYLIASPNQLEVDGESVTPGTIDEVIFAKAERIRQRIRDAQVDATPPEPLLDEFERSLSPLDQDPWPLVAARGVHVPFVDEPGKPTGQYELLEVMQLPKPAIASGRSTFAVEDATGRLAYYPTNWVTVSSMIDVREQSKRQRLAYGVTREKLIYGPTEIQRRARRADGAWSDDDWEMVEPWFRYVPPPKEPVVKLVTDGGRVELDADSVRDLNDFEIGLTNPDVQLELLRPLPPRVDNGTPWRFPVITTAVEVLAQDDEILFPKDPPATDPADRYGFVRSDRTQEADSAAAAIAAKFNEAEALIKQARSTNNADDARRAYNLYHQIVQNAASTPGDKSRAARGKETAEQAEMDIRRRLRLRRGGTTPAPTQETEVAPPVREPRPTQQCWFNDTTPGQVESGAVYQYRIRFNLFNRLAGEPAKFQVAEDATKVYLAGPWSEPSDPIVIPEHVEYYVATQDERDGEIGMRIFKWYEGVWVESRKFQFAVGDRVEGNSRAPVPSLDPDKVADNANVDFDTGAVILDIDFERPLRERKRGSGREGVRFADRAKGVCTAALVGPDGDVVERWLPVDKDNPSQRAAQSRVWQPGR